MLGLELDVSAFAAGPTARLATTVAVVLTIVLVLGAPKHTAEMQQKTALNLRLPTLVDRLCSVCSDFWHVDVGCGDRGWMPRALIDSGGRWRIDEGRAPAATWGAAARVR